MINQKPTNEELESFLREPVNGMVLVPNRDMMLSIIRELLALRQACAATDINLETGSE